MAPTIVLKTAKSVAQATPPNHKTLTIRDVLEEIDEDVEDDSDWELPSLKTIFVLAKVCKEGESFLDLLLKVRDLKQALRHQKHKEVKQRLRRCRRSSRLRAIVRKNPSRAPKGLRKSLRIKRQKDYP